MKIVTLTQGTPEWHAHRALHWNASDAPAMLGCSPYKTRAQLVREVATGVIQEHDAATEARFAGGHRFEALARPIAEQIVGEELFPVVGVDGRYSASFDGLTMCGTTAFEHKSLNDELRACMRDQGNGRDLPKHYRTQMEHQLLVSGAERVLFMASKWKADNSLDDKRHCWYASDPALRAEIVAGWEQFAADVAAYAPEAATDPAPAGRAPDQLPALHIEVTGMVTASNLREWKEAAIAVFQGISTELQTDQDFADAERTVKWCGEIEDQLKAAKAHALSQTASIDELFRTIDAIAEEARGKRLQLDKLVKVRKEAVRGEIVDRGRRAVVDHFDSINATLGEHRIQPPQTLQLDLGAAIKGKKSVASMKDAVDAAVAAAKIAASQQADRVRANVAILAEHADHASLFADRVTLCATKAPEDLRNLCAARIAEHERREAERLEAEREKIRQEEAARIERERVQQTPAAGVAEAQQPLDGAANNAGVATGSRNAPPRESVTLGSLPPATPAGARMRLGDINAAIAPLSITADGLAQLGFRPVGQDRAAKIYNAADFPLICGALARTVAEAPARVSLKAAA